jgi:hypothetical protein
MLAAGWNFLLKYNEMKRTVVLLFRRYSVSEATQPIFSNRGTANLGILERVSIHNTVYPIIWPIIIDFSYLLHHTLNPAPGYRV